MAELTEAAALLQSGHAYRRRLGLREDSGPLVFAGFKAGGFSLYYDDEPYFHFDLEGRWQRVLIDGTHFLKALDASTEAIERVREGPNLVLKRRKLPFDEASLLDSQIRGRALDLLDRLASQGFAIESPADPAEPIPVEELREMLGRIASWDSAAWFRQRETYLGTYGPLPFSPPSCPSPIVLQATLGQANGWGFGGGLAAEPYTRSLSEFEEHARTVADLFGRRAALARGIVLAGRDLFQRPASEIEPYLKITTKVFPISDQELRPRYRDRPEDEPLLDGIYAFLDDFSPPRPDQAGFERLQAWGLRRLDLGIESGDLETREIYGKTWMDDDLRNTVSDLKGAGIAVSLVLLVGSGGREHKDRHAEGSVRLVDSLAIGSGDLVYLVDALEAGGDSGRDLLRRKALTPLDAEQQARELREFREKLAPIAKHRGFKVAPYKLQKQ